LALPDKPTSRFIANVQARRCPDLNRGEMTVQRYHSMSKDRGGADKFRLRSDKASERLNPNGSANPGRGQEHDAANRF